VRRAVLSLGYLADSVVQHFGRSFAGIDLVYEIESQPLGTGGAIRASLRRCAGDAALVVNGDTFLNLEIDRLCTHWEHCRRPIIVGRLVTDTARFGRIETVGGRVVTFAEKGKGGPGMINTGHYVLPTTLLDDVALPQSFSIETDYLAGAVSQRRFDSFVTEGQFIDIGIPDDYLRAQHELAGFTGQSG
jgi:D-glycero-alpha-D-manno-heptose 1-phosphate guanylyltransferase